MLTKEMPIRSFRSTRCAAVGVGADRNSVSPFCVTTSGSPVSIVASSSSAFRATNSPSEITG